MTCGLKWTPIAGQLPEQETFAQPEGLSANTMARYTKGIELNQTRNLGATGVQLTKKPRRNGENRRSDDALRFVVEATAQVTVQHLASPWLREVIAQKFLWHTLFARTIEKASSLASRNILPDLFNSYLILGSRWFSHHEAVETLLSTGRYGDCMVLLRSLLEDTDLMTYFACYPEEAADWRERLSRAPVWSDDVYRKGIRKYRMPRVWKMLKAKGIEPVAERDYPILSSTVHASPWGARFYGRTLPGDPDRLHLSLAPVYDTAAAFSAGLVLQGTYPRPIEAFLLSCTVSKAPKSQWRSIEARYDALIDGWQAKMDLDSWFRNEMVGAEERLSQGEEPEAVLQDLRKRFEEQYGQDINTQTETRTQERDMV